MNFPDPQEKGKNPTKAKQIQSCEEFQWLSEAAPVGLHKALEPTSDISVTGNKVPVQQGYSRSHIKHQKDFNMK